MRRRAVAAALIAVACVCPHPAWAAGESIHAAICRLIDGAAARSGLPAAFLTRLIWQESSFRPAVTSMAGAQGIAQFMPGTAAMRGLADPFDPEQAIPASAALLADLSQRFGNRGLAAAAYNGGPGRVAAFLDARGGLPFETQDYVFRITGRTAQDWRGDLSPTVPMPPVPETPDAPCETAVADLRRGAGPSLPTGPLAPLAPWGVQLAGNFSKDRALAAYRRGQARYASILAEVQPMIVGTRLRSRGTRAFYRVRAPAATRAEAQALCARLHKAGGACIVLRS